MWIFHYLLLLLPLYLLAFFKTNSIKLNFEASVRSNRALCAPTHAANGSSDSSSTTIIFKEKARGRWIVMYRRKAVLIRSVIVQKELCCFGFNDGKNPKSNIDDMQAHNRSRLHSNLDHFHRTHHLFIGWLAFNPKTCQKSNMKHWIIFNSPWNSIRFLLIFCPFFNQTIRIWFASY